MTNTDKWQVIYSMVKEKFLELDRAIKTIDHYRGRYKKTGKPKLPPYAETRYVIKKEFLTKKIREYVDINRKIWYESLSKENLMRLYSYINFVLRRFYSIVDIDVNYFTGKDGRQDYSFRRVIGWESSSPEDAFNEFLALTNDRIKKGIDKDLLWIKPIDKIEDLNQRPRGLISPNLDIYDEKVREQVVSELIVSCLNEVLFEKGETYTFEEAIHGKPNGNNQFVGEVKLSSWVNRDTRFGLDKANIENPEAFEENVVEDSLISRCVLKGLNAEGLPVYLDPNTREYLDDSGKVLPEDTYIAPIERTTD